MSSNVIDWAKQALLDSIDALFEESCDLGDASTALRRRMELRTEMVRCCRSFSELHEGPDPYWADLIIDDAVADQAVEAFLSSQPPSVPS